MGAGNPAATGLHWAESQAAHIRDVTIDMSAGGKSGFFGENGSGGFIDGLTVIGGAIPFNFGNQQYAVNNLTIVGLPGTTACMNLFWSWTLTFTNLHLQVQGRRSSWLVARPLRSPAPRAACCRTAPSASPSRAARRARSCSSTRR